MRRDVCSLLDRSERDDASDEFVFVGQSGDPRHLGECLVGAAVGLHEDDAGERVTPRVEVLGTESPPKRGLVREPVVMACGGIPEVGVRVEDHVGDVF